MHVLKIGINNGSFNPTKNTSNKFKEGVPEQQTVLDGMTMRKEETPSRQQQSKTGKTENCGLYCDIFSFFLTEPCHKLLNWHFILEMAAW